MKRVDLKTSINDYRSPRTREEELQRRRREWAIEQERAREHERRKQKMIEEYEMRRARELGLKSRNRRSSRRSHSKSSSSSVDSPKKSSKTASTPKAVIMSERFEASSSNATRLFKGPEGTKISVIELKKIKVDIHRKIDAAEKTKELNRDIVNPEDVKLKRREGEGIKPIFEREELKKTQSQACEVEERRTVVNVDIKSPRSTRRRTNSVSPRRHRSRSPRRESRIETGRQSHGEKSDRHEDSKYNRQHSRDREHRERHMVESHSSRKSSQDRSRDYRRHRSPSTERDSRYRSTRDVGTYDHDRHDSRNRRYDDDRSRSRRAPLPPPYMEPMHVPFYYSNFARPIMVDPMMAMRGSIPLVRGRMPPLMGTVRPPFAPRFMPHEIFRTGGPQNPRFGRMM